MTNPVSFEIAKLLKEKGFDRNNEYMVFTSVETEKYPEGELFLKPTIADAVMWLFEKHEVYIHMSPHGDEEELLKECKWWFSIYQNTIYNLRAGCKVTPGLNEYSSLPEAYEAAIEYCLTKLI